MTDGEIVWRSALECAALIRAKQLSQHYFARLAHDLPPPLHAREVRKGRFGPGELLDADEERRARDPQLQRLGIMAVDAGHGMLTRGCTSVRGSLQISSNQR